MAQHPEDFHIGPFIIEESSLTDSPLVFESEEFEVPPLKMGGIGNVYSSQTVFLYRLAELFLRGF